jgi:C1A family cysteine protease
VKRHFGTGRDSVSSLDWNYRPRSSIVRRLPAVADLRRHCPPVYDQLHLNSCSASAIAAALRYNELKEGRSHVSSPSRLFTYYNHARRLVTFRDSWGTAWGDGGYGYLPYAFFTSPSLTWDFWTMRRFS